MLVQKETLGHDFPCDFFYFCKIVTIGTFPEILGKFRSDYLFSFQKRTDYYFQHFQDRNIYFQKSVSPFQNLMVVPLGTIHEYEKSL